MFENMFSIYINEISPRYNLTSTRRATKISIALSSLLSDGSVYILGSTDSLYEFFSDSTLLHKLNQNSVRVIEIPAIRFLKRKYNVSYNTSSVSRNGINRFVLLLAKTWKILGPIAKIFLPMIKWNVYHNVNGYKKELKRILNDVEKSGSKAVVFCSVTTFQFFTLWLGNWLKKKYKNNVIIVADIRDPIYGNPHNGWLGRNKLFSTFVTRILLRRFDYIITVGKLITADLRKQVRASYEKIFTIPTGFVQEELKELLRDGCLRQQNYESKTSNVVKILYAGSLEKRTKEFSWFISELREVSKLLDSLVYEIHYAGKDIELFENILKKEGAKGILGKVHGYLDLESLKTLQRSADVLLLISDLEFGGRAVTGKLFEYLASFKPILCVGPNDSDVLEYLDDSLSILLTYGSLDSKEKIENFFLGITSKYMANFEKFCQLRERIIRSLELEKRMLEFLKNLERR